MPHPLCLELQNIKFCVFHKRVNRFLVEAYQDTKKLRLSLNNTGRLTDLLLQGRKACFLPRQTSKTEGRLIGIEIRKDIFALLDTNLMELAFAKALKKGLISWLKNAETLKRNPRWGGNKFDFLLKNEDKEVICELKGALLKKGKAALYPDCPSSRGRRHIVSLIQCTKENQKTLLCFITSLPDVSFFKPNTSVDAQMGKLIKKAFESGVMVKSVAFLFKPPQVFLRNDNLPLKLEEN